MPFTPFHLGPAALIKSALPRKFSFLVFALTQIIIDLEPYYYLIRGEYPAHRIFHTFIGVAIPISIAVLAGRLLFHSMSPAVLIFSAAIGGYSHVLFDGLMHADMRPLIPWTSSNPLLGAVDEGWLHWACVISGLIGIAVLRFRR